MDQTQPHVQANRLKHGRADDTAPADDLQRHGVIAVHGHHRIVRGELHKHCAGLHVHVAAVDKLLKHAPAANGDAT